MRRTVLFRVDGGRVWGISMGHLKRALLLAGRLADSYRIVFIMKNYIDGVAFAQQQGIEVEIIPVDADIDEQLITLCDKYKPEKIIIDLRSTPYTEFFSYTRSRNIQTVVFDITGECTGSPDILINDSLVKQFTRYAHVSAQTRLACGPQYFMVECCHPIVPIREEVMDIMITMGGSDPAGLTVKILNSLLGRAFPYTINVVLGPAFTDRGAVREIAGTKRSVTIYENPANFLELLSRQDIVISAAGRTLYECAYFGRPVIIVPSIEHEVLTAAEYEILSG